VLVEVARSAANTSIATTPSSMSPIRNCLSNDSDRLRYSTSRTTVCATNQTPALIPSDLRSPAKKRTSFLFLNHPKRSRFAGTRAKRRRIDP
jgi:hypothetical protein